MRDNRTITSVSQSATTTPPDSDKMYIVVWSVEEDLISHHNEVTFTTFLPAIDIDIGQDHELQYNELKVGVSLPDFHFKTLNPMV